MIVQRLSVTAIMEDRMVRVMGPVYHWIQKRNFVHQDGRVYLTRCIVGKPKDRLKDAKKRAGEK